MISQNLRITVLVNDRASDGFLSEHGLSFWIEYADKCILFDTGQSDMMLHNAEILGVDISRADAVILSHGHYDHTGALPAVLDLAVNARIYMHPCAMEPKFNKKYSGVKYIGISDPAKTAVLDRDIIWTDTYTQVFPGLYVTGKIPRITDFEDVGGSFFLDRNCYALDDLLDDQSLFIESEKGLVVVLGCAHAGIVNILQRIADLSNKQQIHMILGGMHLLHASDKRIERTIQSLSSYNIEKILPMHCTGSNACNKLQTAFAEQYVNGLAGMQISDINSG